MSRIFSVGILLHFFLILNACSTAEEPASREENTSGPAKEESASIKQITAAEFELVRSKQHATVIDVRTPAEVVEGYIDGTTAFIDVNGVDFSTELEKLDKSATYIVYCRSGGRSMRASEIMIQQGFKNVYNLQGGITGWTGKIVR